MFADVNLSNNIFEILGLLVTIVGIWLVVSQLRESRLSTQLSGFLELSSQFTGIAASIEFVDDLSVSEEWKSFDGSQAFAYLTEDVETRKMYKHVAAFYETLSALVKRGALDYQLIAETYGGIGARRWRTLEKAVTVHRKALSSPGLYENWEWFAKEFPD